MVTDLKDRYVELSAFLLSAQSLDQVVKTINVGGTPLFGSNELAGQYAYIAAKESGYGFSDIQLFTHLEYLQQFGAHFDYGGAFKEAKRIREKLA